MIISVNLLYRSRWLWISLLGLTLSEGGWGRLSLAQILPHDAFDPPSVQPLPEQAAPMPLPPPDELLQPARPGLEGMPEPGEDVPETITVQRFEVMGSNVFTPAELATVTAPFTNRPLTFAGLFAARDAVTQFYVDRGYVTSGALIPPQTLENGVVQIQVIEGRLEAINVSGNTHLQSDYLRSRLNLATAPPLNVDQLLTGLQLLQLNPLIETLSAELTTGVQPGTSRLNLAVQEADEIAGSVEVNNSRSPSVGSWRRQLGTVHSNLSGLGDQLSLDYSNTDGSNSWDISYTLPVSPHNHTLSFNVGVSNSRVIERPFNILDIESFSNYYELTYRHLLSQTPTEEFALSLTASRRESRSEFLKNFGGAIPFVSIGTDSQGRTHISALRFTHEWTRRGEREVIALRSQFNLGLNILGVTNTPTGPDGQFFSWRGQGQWVRLLAPETLFVWRSDLQLAANSLVAQEQFGLGGSQTVRGYRQDQLLTDNGFLTSAEVRFPLSETENLGRLTLTPFVAFGMGWNTGNARPKPSNNLLLSTGLGLQWDVNDLFAARIDWGIPLVAVPNSGNSLQESGLSFAFTFNPF
jgi:hemolysin activation/secretion protein